MRTFIVFSVLSIFLLVGAFAQEETEEPTYDYTDSANYQHPDFYSNSDPSQWDWSQIDWEKMDFERADLYALPKFYQNLPAERYSDLNYRLVPDFYLIEDHSLIDGTKYLQDFGCEACRVVFEEALFDEPAPQILPEDALIYNSDGTIRHQRYGERASVPLLPSGVSLYITDSRLIVRCAAETISFCMPESAQAGRFSISTNGQTLDYQGNTIDGLAEFIDGYLYVPNWAPLVINDVEITIDVRSYHPTLYFDGLDHSAESPHYISFNAEEGVIHIGTSDYSSGPDLRFLRHNGIFTMLGGEDLMIGPSTATNILIQSRREEGLIPLVTVESTDPSYTSHIENGGTLILLDSEKVNAYPQSGEVGGSVSFTLIARDAQGNPLLGTAEQEQKMVFDRNNNFVIVPEEAPEEELECYLCAVDFRENTILYSNALQAFQRFNLDIEDEAGDSVAIYRLARLLEELPPTTRESIAGITIVPDEEIEDICGVNADACAFQNSHHIFLMPSRLEVLPHEADHTLTYEIFAVSHSEAIGVVTEIADLVQTYGSLENAPESAQRRVAEYLASRHAPLELEWEQVAGGENFYDDVEEHLGPRIVANRNAAAWDDGEWGPRFGCFSAYGCNDIYEDIAVAGDTVRDNPLRVLALINPTSEFYTEQIGSQIGGTGLTMTPELAEDWAQRYRGRVELLYANDFITEEDYQAVMSEPETGEEPLAGLTEEERSE